MNYYITTYGCAMNYADSDNIRKFCKEAGFFEVDSYKNADIIIINSCSIRGQAEDKISGWGIKARKVSTLKKIFLLTGCMAQRYDRKDGGINRKYTKQILRKFPWINVLVANSDLDEIPKLVSVYLQNYNISKSNVARCSVLLSSSLNQDCSESSVVQQKINNTTINQKYLLSKDFVQNNSDTYRAVIPISVGCDNFCSYCIVPLARGKLEFRSADSIITEVKNFVSKGGKILTLAGQNVNNWIGVINNKKAGFLDLLKKICEIEGDFWVTFISSNPMDFSDELGLFISSHPKVMKYINIAVQSGSDRILKLMNRKYSVNRFEEIVKVVKSVDENFRVTTDIIVGFPSETMDDFQKSLELIEKLGIEMVYLGKYSPREGTASSKLNETVSSKEKESRQIQVNEIVNKIRLAKHEKIIGSTLKVLVLGGKRGFSYYGHEVTFTETAKQSTIGKFIDSEIVGASRSGLKTKIKD